MKDVTEKNGRVITLYTKIELPPGTFSLALQAADLHDTTIEIKTDLSISLGN
jgi:hypothetical protein